MNTARYRLLVQVGERSYYECFRNDVQTLRYVETKQRLHHPVKYKTEGLEAQPQDKDFSIEWDNQERACIVLAHKSAPQTSYAVGSVDKFAALLNNLEAACTKMLAAFPPETGTAMDSLVVYQLSIGWNRVWTLHIKAQMPVKPYLQAMDNVPNGPNLAPQTWHQRHEQDQQRRRDDLQWLTKLKDRSNSDTLRNAAAANITDKSHQTAGAADWFEAPLTLQISQVAAERQRQVPALYPVQDPVKFWSEWHRSQMQLAKQMAADGAQADGAEALASTAAGCTLMACRHSPLLCLVHTDAADQGGRELWSAAEAFEVIKVIETLSREGRLAQDVKQQLGFVFTLVHCFDLPTEAQ